ncbi:MAG: DedA family protein [Euzebyales bacterium]|nr:DedA family protein [Euzebyales bacterium]
MVDTISGMDPTTAYVVIGVLAFLEAAAFIGLFVPGETALLLGGMLAAQGRVSLVPLIVVAVVAAILGDAVGYEIGRRWGFRLLAIRLLRRRADTVRRASAAMVRGGGAVVFVGRWVGAMRACVPALAGMTRMPYRTFAFYNVPGGITRAAGCMLLGYLAGVSLSRLEAVTGIASSLILGTAAIVAAVVLTSRWLRRRGRAATHSVTMTSVEDLVDAEDAP